MTIPAKMMHLLVIEDNPADFIIVKDFLSEGNRHTVIHHATTFATAEAYLSTNPPYDAIFLDLSLPDAFGETLVNDVVALAVSTPVIVLTGNANKKFGIDSLKWGITDYLFKDELTPFLLNKSLTYAIERQQIYTELKKSEKKYKDLFQASPQPMWVFDLETYRFLSINDAAIRHYGYSREEFLKMTIKDIRPSEDIDKLVKEVDHYKTEIEFSSPVFRHTLKSGEIIFMEIKSNSIDFEGKAARLILCNDITEKLKAEQSLKFSEQRFKALVQDGSDLIGILDLEGNYKYVSPTAETILGKAAEEFIGQNAFDFVHEEDKEGLLESFSLLPTQKRINISPFRFKDAGNNWRWIETIVTNMMDDPAVEGIVTNSRDVTERRNYTEAIEEQNKKLREIAWMQSHMVRAPLARILGIIEVLNTQTKEEVNTTELLNSLQSSATELDDILRRIVKKTENVPKPIKK